ncbi:hypothetical protein NFI96_026276, partial [Prochilodus magdalenae]
SSTHIVLFLYLFLHILKEVEDFKAIISSPDSTTPDQHTVDHTSLSNHVSGAEEPAIWDQNEPDISVLKFLHSLPEPCREDTEADAAEVGASSAGSSGTHTKPKRTQRGAATVERLRSEIQDMRGELDVLRNQHK